MSEITLLAEEPTPAVFATPADVQVRLGRPLADGEDERVTALIVMATTAIAAALDRDEEWAAGLDPVPPALRITSIEMVTRVLQNPGGVRSRQETLGAHSHGETFADTSATLALTEAEERRCRRAVFKNGGMAGSSLGSAVLEQIGDALGGGSSKVAGLNDGDATA